MSSSPAHVMTRRYFALQTHAVVRICFEDGPVDNPTGGTLPGCYGTIDAATQVADLLNAGEAGAAYIERRRADTDLGAWVRLLLTGAITPFVDIDPTTSSHPAVHDAS